jgi:hypothetical protein
MLAAALAKLERIDEARVAAERVLARQPNFTGVGRSTAVGAVAVLAEPLIEALRSAGLPGVRAFGGKSALAIACPSQTAFWPARTSRHVRFSAAHGGEADIVGE